MDWQELTPLDFRRRGLLQEVNRQYLHVLGYALSVGTDNVVRCHRTNDDEGIIFGDPFTTEEQERARKLTGAFEKGAALRRARLGFDIQPLDWQP